MNVAYGAIVCCVTLGCLAISSHAQTTKANDVEAIASSVEQKNAEAVVSFTKVALDDRVAPEDRRRAIDFLGKMGRTEAILFLIQNYELLIDVPGFRDEAAELRRYPCKNALRMGDWKTAQIMIVRITDCGSEKSLPMYADTLKNILGSKQLESVLSAEILRAQEEKNEKRLHLLELVQKYSKQ